MGYYVTNSKASNIRIRLEFCVAGHGDGGSRRRVDLMRASRVEYQAATPNILPSLRTIDVVGNKQTTSPRGTAETCITPSKGDKQHCAQGRTNAYQSPYQSNESSTAHSWRYHREAGEIIIGFKFSGELPVRRLVRSIPVKLVAICSFIHRPPLWVTPPCTATLS